MTTENIQKTIKLNPRLAKIAELLPVCRCIADIGTDHAYVPIYALLSGKAECAIASDINRGPVERARTNAAAFSLEDKLSLRLGAGLETVKPDEAETIVIAGMGGILISDILENSRDTVNSAKYLILQPMTAVKELREYLSANSFTVEKEVLVAEDEKIYNILCVRVGGKTAYTPKEMLLGRDLDKTSPELYGRYFAQIEKKLKIRLAGLKASKNEANEKLAKVVENQIELIERV